MFKKVAMLLILLTAISALILPSIYSSGNTPAKKKIPFVGMTLSYQVYLTTETPPIISKIITFYGDASEPDYIYVRDSHSIDPSDDSVWQIDIMTRKVVGEEYYLESLFPTNLHVGDEVICMHGGGIGPVTIIGSQIMSAMGKQVDAWIAYQGGTWGARAMYYEKKTGIWLGGNVVWWDGDTLHSWTQHLVSTNAPLFEED